jgi:hypothetical protein
VSLQIFLSKENKRLIKIIAVCLLILTAAGNLFGQYKGEPVKKDKLVQALRSKQLQTRHIVAIINSNGVDFRLTPETRKELLAAGARPEIIQAVIYNFRGVSKNDVALAETENTKSINNAAVKSEDVKPPTPPSYNDLLIQAMNYHEKMANSHEAMSILKEAAKLEPENPLTYQMIGYVYLYGLNDFAWGEKSMRDSIRLGGSAVLRVKHDDDGKFTQMCEGSLYISRDTVRFESDNNAHTFETTKQNVNKIKIEKLSTSLWKNRSVYRIILRDGKNQSKFRFSPLTGKRVESELVQRLIRWRLHPAYQNM